MLALSCFPHPIATLPLAQLRPDAFRRLFATLADRGSATDGLLAPKTLQQVDKALRADLGVAVNDGLLAKNPTPERRVHVPRTERPWLDADDVRRLVGFARFRDPELEAPIVSRLSLGSGAVRSAGCAGLTSTCPAPRPRRSEPDGRQREGRRVLDQDGDRDRRADRRVDARVPGAPPRQTRRADRERRARRRVRALQGRRVRDGSAVARHNVPSQRAADGPIPCSNP